MLRIFAFLVTILYVCFSLAEQFESIDDFEKKINDARTQGKVADAKALINELSVIAAKQNNEELKGIALFHLSKNDIAQDSYIAAREKLYTVVDIFTRTNNKKRLGQAYMQLSTTHFYLSEYPNTLEYDQKAADIFVELADNQNLSGIYNNTGTTLQLLGDFNGAVNSFQKSLDLLQDLDLEENMADVLFNLGSLKVTLGDHEEALMYFNDVLAIDLKYGNISGIGYTRLVIGRTLGELERYEEARIQLAQAQTLFQSVASPKNDGFAKLTLARIEVEEGNYGIAQELIDSVLTIADDFPVLKVDAFQVGAKNTVGQQKYNEALVYINSALEDIKSVHRLPVEATLYQLKVEALEGLKEFKSALDALKYKNIIDEQILDEKKRENLALTEAKIHSQRQDYKIELLEKEQNLQTEKLRRQKLNRNILICSLLFVFTLILLLYGRITQRRVNNQLKKQVRIRTEELQQKNIQLSQAYKELESDTVTDALTSLKNRRYLNKVIEADLQLSFRRHQDELVNPKLQPDESDLIVFVIDIDNFKHVNDEYGHNAGDTVLIEFAHRLREVFRQSDYLVRWGGEEFVAVARFLKRSDGDKFADRLLNNIQSRPFELTEGQSISLTCSVGYACYPCYPNTETNVSWKCLVFLADTVLYFAKDAGKNTWVGIESLSNDIQLDESTTAEYVQAMVEQNKMLIRRPK